MSKNTFPILLFMTSTALYILYQTYAPTNVDDMQRLLTQLGALYEQPHLSNIVRVWTSPFLHATDAHFMNNMQLLILLLFLVNLDMTNVIRFEHAFLASIVTSTLFTCINHLLASNSPLTGFIHHNLALSEGYEQNIVVGMSSMLYVMYSYVSVYLLYTTLYAYKKKQPTMHFLWFCMILIINIGLLSVFQYQLYTEWMLHIIPYSVGVIMAHIAFIYHLRTKNRHT